MFSWIVKRLNQAIEVRRDESKEQGRNTVIGVLDIYGFEIFNNNRCVRVCVRASPSLAACISCVRLHRPPATCPCSASLVLYILVVCFVRE